MLQTRSRACGANQATHAVLATVASALFGLAVPVHAQEASALQVRSLAATCASCHGTAGRAVDGSTVPGLAGMPAAYFNEQMKAFKSGARPATIMHQLAKGYSDAQIESMAAFFAAQAK